MKNERIVDTFRTFPFATRAKKLAEIAYDVSFLVYGIEAVNKNTAQEWFAKFESRIRDSENAAHADYLSLIATI